MIDRVVSPVGEYDRSVTLDPEAAAYLETVAAQELAPLWETDLRELRRSYDAAAARLFGPAPALASVEDRSAGGVPARIYRPRGDERTALVYFHGGGWVVGGLASHDRLCRALAARADRAVIAVDYRLAPEHPYPAAIEDAWTATRWAADTFAVIAVGGDSAGGQLAASVALRARDAGLPLALQLLAYPVTGYQSSTGSYAEFVVGTGFNATEMDWYWSRYLPDPARGSEPDCSPLHAADLHGVAPALVLTAGHDPLRDEGEAYARALRDAGVTVTLERYEGLIHGFLRMPAVIGRADGAIEAAAAAVADALPA